MRKITCIASFLLCLAVSAFAQTPSKVERELVKSLETLSKYGTYGGGYDEEKLGKAQGDFKDKLLKSLKDPATLKYSFAQLRKQMFIATSPDGKFRVYSWDLEDGGTMHDYDAVYQYQGSDGKVRVRSASSGNEEDYGSFVPKVYEVSTAKGKVYLAIAHSVGSTQDHAQSVDAMKVVGDKLDDKVKIFKTKEGMTNSIGFAYNAFSVVDRKNWDGVLILFDGKTNILKIPVVVENEKYYNGEVTNRFINYKFNGEYFVKAN